MTQPAPLTPFQKMRNNRARRVKPEAPRNVLAQIDAAEEEIEREWAELQRAKRAEFADTEAWLRDTRQQMTLYPRAQQPAPPLPWWHPLRAVALCVFIWRCGRALTAAKRR